MQRSCRSEARARSGCSSPGRLTLLLHGAAVVRDILIIRRRAEAVGVGQGGDHLGGPAAAAPCVPRTVAAACRLLPGPRQLEQQAAAALAGAHQRVAVVVMGAQPQGQLPRVLLQQAGPAKRRWVRCSGGVNAAFLQQHSASHWPSRHTQVHEHGCKRRVQPRRGRASTTRPSPAPHLQLPADALHAPQRLHHPGLVPHIAGVLDAEVHHARAGRRHDQLAAVASSGGGGGGSTRPAFRRHRRNPTTGADAESGVRAAKGAWAVHK